MAETSVSFDLDFLAKPRREPPIGLSRREEALIEGLRQGAELAYEELINEYQLPVFNLVYRLLEDPTEASDVVQEVFLKIFRHIGSFRGRSSLKTWIYRIAVNEAHNHRRWFSRHRKHEIGFEKNEGEPGRSLRESLRAPGGSPFEIALREETVALIGEALSKLKPVFREAVVLRDIEGFTYEEIASVLGVSLGTVKSRIVRGREALRKQLEGRLTQERMFAWTPEPAEQE